MNIFLKKNLHQLPGSSQRPQYIIPGLDVRQALFLQIHYILLRDSVIFSQRFAVNAHYKMSGIF